MSLSQELNSRQFNQLANSMLEAVNTKEADILMNEGDLVIRKDSANYLIIKKDGSDYLFSVNGINFLPLEGADAERAATIYNDLIGKAEEVQAVDLPKEIGHLIMSLIQSDFYLSYAFQINSHIHAIRYAWGDKDYWIIVAQPGIALWCPNLKGKPDVDNSTDITPALPFLTHLITEIRIPNWKERLDVQEYFKDFLTVAIRERHDFLKLFRFRIVLLLKDSSSEVRAELKEKCKGIKMFDDIIKEYEEKYSIYC